MAQTVSAYVGSCVFCLQFKPRRGTPAGKLQPICPPKRRFAVFGFDHLGPFKKTTDGNEHIIAAVDLFTKFLIGRAVPNTGSVDSIKFLKDDGLYKFGTPQKLISDNASGFTSKLFEEFIEEERIKHITNITSNKLLLPNTQRRTGRLKREMPH